ncbi:MAG TPA: response regulator transcription factor [Alphaproteobacteria bacterium]|nr:response regulator transcription factor [Alphaproteobacteria bacterium]
MTRKILVIEDDQETAAYLAQGLGEEGFETDTVGSGRDGLFLATSGDYSLIILDRMLPELDGLAVMRAIRAAKIETPVLILSALGTLDDRIKGLRGGGDDYLVKPFAFSELLARIDALMRRRVPDSATTTLSCGDLSMDLLGRTVTREGKTIELQPREFKLLEYLLRHKNHVVTRTMLLDGVWDYHFDPQTNVIDVHISRLRQKIDSDFSSPLIHTIRGAGYKLTDQA